MRREEIQERKEIQTTRTLKQDLWREVQNQVKAPMKEMKT